MHSVSQCRGNVMCTVWHCVCLGNAMCTVWHSFCLGNAMCTVWHSVCRGNVIFVTSGPQVLRVDTNGTGVFNTGGRKMPKNVAGFL